MEITMTTGSVLEIVGWRSHRFRSGQKLAGYEPFYRLFTRSSPTEINIEDAADNANPGIMILEDVIDLECEHCVGNSNFIYPGAIANSINYHGLDDTFDGWWRDIADLAWRLFDKTKSDDICFATLWRCEFVTYPSTPDSAEEYDEYFNLLGVLDMKQLQCEMWV